MNFPRSHGALFSLLGLAFLFGIGAASGVYWLLVAPANNDQAREAKVQSSPVQTDTVAYEQPVRTDESSASNPTSAVPSSLDDLDRIKSSFARSLALRNLLANSDETQVANLLNQSKDLFSNNQRYGIQTVVIRRLAQLNPKLALRHVREMSERNYPAQFVGVVYEEWVHSNLDEAIAHARTLDDDWKQSALHSIVQERNDLSEEVLKSIARDLGNEQIAITAIARQKLEDAMEDPERAWNEYAINMQDDRQHMWSIAEVASVWVEQSGLGVLDQIYQSLTNVEVRQNVMRNVLQDVAASDPAEAFRIALTVENDQYHHIARNVIDTWARSNPQAALTAASSVEKKTLRRELEEEVVRTWAYEEPHRVLDSVDSFPRYVQASAISSALGQIVRESPEEAVSLIAGMESGATRLSAANTVASTWSYQDPKAALDWVLNEPSVEDLRPQLLSGILYGLVRVDPELAMSAALSQPIEEGKEGMRRGMGMELNVISSLSYSDLDKALELLPRVRKGPTKLQAYQVVSGALIRNGDVDEALNMAQQFPKSERSDFYVAVATAWAGSDPEGLLNSMSRLPTEKAKSRAAMSLISYNRFQEALTDEQIEEAKKYLTDEDAKALEEQDEGHIFLGF